jgi:hypothetical protein
MSRRSARDLGPCLLATYSSTPILDSSRENAKMPHRSHGHVPLLLISDLNRVCNGDPRPKILTMTIKFYKKGPNDVLEYSYPLRRRPWTYISALLELATAILVASRGG